MFGFNHQSQTLNKNKINKNNANSGSWIAAEVKARRSALYRDLTSAAAKQTKFAPLPQTFTTSQGVQLLLKHFNVSTSVLNRIFTPSKGTPSSPLRGSSSSRASSPTMCCGLICSVGHEATFVNLIHTHGKTASKLLIMQLYRT